MASSLKNACWTENIARNLEHLQHTVVNFDFCSLALDESGFISLFSQNILILFIIICSAKLYNLVLLQWEKINIQLNYV